MSGESGDQGPERAASSVQQSQQQEQILAAIALLLGPDTEYPGRVRAAQHLGKAGPEILPLLLNTLHSYPEIATPAWPWWPPQYEQISRVLIQLGHAAQLSLKELLYYPQLTQPPGPVLWTSVIEAAGLLPQSEYEPLLRAGLQAPWWTVRYASAMAIANRATQSSLCPESRQALYQSQSSDSELPVRLICACALLRCADSNGLEALMQILEAPIQPEIRKVTLFILATELPIPLLPAQKQRLNTLLLESLQNEDHQIALNAARALRGSATPDILPALNQFLEYSGLHIRLATLVALEELASRKTMRYAVQQQQIPKRVASLLHNSEPEIRQQACSTLAALGGEYATAVLGTIILNNLHPAHLEAIEAVRLLPEVQHSAVFARVMRWLLYALAQPLEVTQVSALDTFSYLIWRARVQSRRTALRAIAQELSDSGMFFQLLASSSAWVRQRTVDLLGLLDAQLYAQSATLLEMLHHDIDSGVRAHIASVLGQTSARWAIPDLLLGLLDCDEKVAETALNALDAISLLDDALVTYTVKELAAYNLPIWSLHDRRHLAHAARAWLKERKKSHY